MYIQQLTILMETRRLRRSSIATIAGISRAAVTRWFREADMEGFVNVESRSLSRLATALNISTARLVSKMPPLAPYAHAFLWDHLYPNMERFLLAVHDGRLPALARLVQVLGFADATKVIGGDTVIRNFERYKHFIKPARRRALEQLWTLYQPST